MGERNPVGHHITDIVLTGIADDRVRARSKGIGINADGPVDTAPRARRFAGCYAKCGN